jgi:hypothetical protein
MAKVKSNGETCSLGRVKCGVPSWRSEPEWDQNKVFDDALVFQSIFESLYITPQLPQKKYPSTFEESQAELLVDLGSGVSISGSDSWASGRHLIFLV